MTKHICYIAVQIASQVEAQKHADNEEIDNAHAVPDEVPHTRTSAVPDEMPDTMANAAPGSSTGIVQGKNGAPMRVPGSGLRAKSGKVSCCSTPWALCVCVCVRL